MKNIAKLCLIGLVLRKLKKFTHNFAHKSFIGLASGYQYTNQSIDWGVNLNSMIFPKLIAGSRFEKLKRRQIASSPNGKKRKGHPSPSPPRFPSSQTRPNGRKE